MPDLDRAAIQARLDAAIASGRTRDVEASLADLAALLDENERLRKALADLLGVADAHCLRMEPCEGYECDCWQRSSVGARAALAGREGV